MPRHHDHWKEADEAIAERLYRLVVSGYQWHQWWTQRRPLWIDDLFWITIIGGIALAGLLLGGCASEPPPVPHVLRITADGTSYGWCDGPIILAVYLVPEPCEEAWLGAGSHDPEDAVHR
jgi:hypothetical protein